MALSELVCMYEPQLLVTYISSDAVFLSPNLDLGISLVISGFLGADYNTTINP